MKLLGALAAVGTVASASQLPAETIKAATPDLSTGVVGIAMGIALFLVQRSNTNSKAAVVDKFTLFEQSIEKLGKSIETHAGATSALRIEITDFVARMETKQDEAKEKAHEASSRVGALSTKVDSLSERMARIESTCIVQHGKFS